jgi:DNA-binding transcriptional regulator YhcF (GntR family)
MEAPLDIALDRSAEVPLGVQLAWALRARILGGRLTAGHRLPGVRELAASTGVNANTVRAVYARLEAEGLVTAEHGRGTFVNRTAQSDARLGEVARRAMEAAREAGLDPKDLAAVLYSGAPGWEAGAEEPPPAEDAAAARRRLRAEIAELERELAEADLVRRMGVAREDVLSAPLPRPSGRMLDVAELRAVRDDLAGRLRLLREAAVVEDAETAADSSTNTATGQAGSGPRPIVRWSFGG